MKRKLVYTLAALALAAAQPAEATTKWTLSGALGTGGNAMTMTSDDDPALKITDVRLTASGATTLNIYGGKNFYDGCPEGSVDLDLTVPIYFGDDTTVQYSVAQLGNGTFSGNKQLRSVKLPSTLVSMEKENFKGCTSLKSVDMSLATGLTTMGPQVFNGCSSLEGYFYFPAGITTLENNMFNGTKISGFYAPGMASMENQVFYNVKTLETIQFGPNMNSFGREAFRDQGQVIRTVFFEGNPPTTKTYFDRGGNQFMDMLGANAVIFVPMNAAKNAISDGWKTYLEDTESGWTSSAVQTANTNTYTLPAYDAETGVWTDGSLYNGYGSVKRTYILRCWDPSDTSATAALLAY